MRIGVDIDGVVANVLPLWLAQLNKTFNQQITGNAGMNFADAAAYGLSYEQLEKFYQEKEDLFVEQSEPMPEAAKYLAMLMEKHQIYLVSARNPYQFDRTSAWLAKYKIPFTDLVLLGSTDKRQTCLECSLDIFVEDSMDNAVKLASHGIPVLLFDAPYNQAELPKSVERCFSWAEIFKKITERRFS